MVIQGLAAMGAGALGRPGVSRAQGLTTVRSLGEIAAERGLLFGTAIDLDTLANPAQAALYKHHARVFTSDNVLKFGALRPIEGPANFADADRLVAFCAKAQIPLRGHCLIWNEWTPEWVQKLSSARCAYWLDRHIDEVVGRYAGQLQSWDVVNEPFWPQHGRPGGYRNGQWFAAMGKDYVVRAFKRARAADPAGKIAINESGPEWETTFGTPARVYREGLLGLIEEVQAAGAKLDSVGLQCHWFAQFAFDAGRFTDYLHALAARGVNISLSEIDINDARMTGSEAARDAKVGARYAQLIGAALREPKVEALITWQLSDNASWLNTEPALWGPGARRPRPLPFDGAFQPKAAYGAIAKALAATR